MSVATKKMSSRLPCDPHPRTTKKASASAAAVQLLLRHRGAAKDESIEFFSALSGQTDESNYLILNSFLFFFSVRFLWFLIVSVFFDAPSDAHVRSGFAMQGPPIGGERRSGAASSGRRSGSMTMIGKLKRDDK